MPIEVTLAKLSPTMESGQLVRWNVKVGDKVKEGDTLAEVQTDKAVMPMEAFDEGTVAELSVAEGAEVALGQRVLVLAKKGEDPKQVAEQFKGAKTESKSEAKAEAKPETSKAAEEQPAHAENGQKVAVAAESHAGSANGGRVKSTPLARKVAAEAKVDIAGITGSGPSGRVVRSDVEAFLSSGGGKASPAGAPAKKAAAPIPKAGKIPHSPMRKTIAKRMSESQAASPVIHVTVDVRIDRLMDVREALNKTLAAEKIKLSVGDFVTKAVAQALRRHPVLNSSWEPDALVIHPDVNVGIAVAMDGGLMVPVLQNTDALGLKEIRQGTESLAKSTREGTLKPSQMMGGTFTISNLGMYGVKQFDAIINQPEVAILAVGAGEKRPVVEGDALVVGTVMTLNLTADHRAVDGAAAAEFMRTLKGFLEEPATMLL